MSKILTQIPLFGVNKDQFWCVLTEDAPHLHEGAIVVDAQGDVWRVGHAENHLIYHEPDYFKPEASKK